MKVLPAILLAFGFLAGTAFSADTDDRLVLVGASYGNNVLAICDSKGEVLWKHDTAGPESGRKAPHINMMGSRRSERDWFAVVKDAGYHRDIR